MDAGYLDQAEVFLTNVCNLNCQGCNTLSNFALSGGTQTWSEHADDYERWAQILDITEIRIMGGEPLSVPDIQLWIQHLRRLWPSSKLYVWTNGTLLSRQPRSFYEICVSNGVTLAISIHNHAWKDSLRDQALAWLDHGTEQSLSDEDIETTHYSVRPAFVESYNRMRDPSWPDCQDLLQWRSLPQHIQTECRDRGLDFELMAQQYQSARDSQKFRRLTDRNGQTVELHLDTSFMQDPVILGSRGVRLHDSDPDLAHAICLHRQAPQFYRGRLYKCALSHVFQDFDHQFVMDLEPWQRELIHGYQACESTWSRAFIADFVANLSRPIAQCRLCPEQDRRAIVEARPAQKIQLIKRRRDWDALR